MPSEHPPCDGVEVNDFEFQFHTEVVDAVIDLSYTVIDGVL